MIGSDRLRAILGPSAPRHFVPLPKTLARFVERMSSSVGRTTKNKQGPMAPDVFFGTPTMIRTWDPQIRNLVLYPTELPGLCGFQAIVDQLRLKLRLNPVEMEGLRITTRSSIIATFSVLTISNRLERVLHTLKSINMCVAMSSRPYRSLSD